MDHLKAESDFFFFLTHLPSSLSERQREDGWGVHCLALFQREGLTPNRMGKHNSVELFFDIPPHVDCQQTCRHCWPSYFQTLLHFTSFFLFNKLLYYCLCCKTRHWLHYFLRYFCQKRKKTQAAKCIFCKSWKHTATTLNSMARDIIYW